jgi:hypothetical protein
VAGCLSRPDVGRKGPTPGVHPAAADPSERGRGDKFELERLEGHSKMSTGWRTPLAPGRARHTCQPDCPGRRCLFSRTRKQNDRHLIPDHRSRVRLVAAPKWNRRRIARRPAPGIDRTWDVVAGSMRASWLHSQSKERPRIAGAIRSLHSTSHCLLRDAAMQGRPHARPNGYVAVRPVGKANYTEPTTVGAS